MLTYFSEKRKEWLLQSLFSCESDEKGSACVRKLLHTGVPISYLLTSSDENGWRLLQLLALHNHVRTLSFIRKVTAEDEEKKALFKEACDHEGVCGMTPLIIAISSGHEPITCSLLETDCDITKTGARARNAAYLICRGDLCDAFQYLLDGYGSEKVIGLCSGVDTNGYNALHAAVLAGKIEMCELLLGSDDGGIGRASLTQSSKDDSNVLHLVARLSKVQNSPEVSKKIAEILLTHLRRCYPQSHKEVMTELLLAPDCFGSTPLHIAAVCANAECLQLLLDNIGGGSTNISIAQDNDGYHPTVIACVEFSRIITDIQTKYPHVGGSLSLHSEDANIKVEDQDELLHLQRKAKGHMDCLLSLLSAGYPLDGRDFSDNTLFHTLAYCPHGEAVGDLVRSILNKNSGFIQDTLEISNDRDWTCFHVALSQQQPHPSSDGLLADDDDEQEDSSKDLPPPPPNSIFFPLLFELTSTSFQSSFDSSKPKKDVDSHIQRSKCGAHRRIPLDQRQALLQNNYTLEGVANYLLALPHTPKVVVVTGAGISTSAGIPDFRSGNGLYANSATAELFSTEFLHNKPEQFYAQVKRLFLPVVDRQYKPTAAHAMLRLLHDCGWLTRVYTQNIDMLESIVFVEDNDAEDETSLMDDKIVECHGSMRRFRCTSITCGYTALTPHEMQERVWTPIRQDLVPRCPICDALLRPDATFFGEPLPEQFHCKILNDIPECDLLLVMGTSLLVYPVASLPQMAPANAVRMFWNKEATGCFQFISAGNDDSNDSVLSRDIQAETRGYRDVFHRESCDTAAREFAALIKRADELETLITKHQA